MQEKNDATVPPMQQIQVSVSQHFYEAHHE